MLRPLKRLINDIIKSSCLTLVVLLNSSNVKQYCKCDQPHCFILYIYRNVYYILDFFLFNSFLLAKLPLISRTFTV